MGPRPTGVDGRVGPAAAVTKPMQSKHFHSLLAYKSVSFRGGAWPSAREASRADLPWGGGRGIDSPTETPASNIPPLNDDDNDDDEDDEMMMMILY